MKWPMLMPFSRSSQRRAGPLVLAGTTPDAPELAHRGVAEVDDGDKLLATVEHHHAPIAQLAHRIDPREFARYLDLGRREGTGWHLLHAGQDRRTQERQNATLGQVSILLGAIRPSRDLHGYLARRRCQCLH
jgi:hypothetical protein